MKIDLNHCCDNVTQSVLDTYAYSYEKKLRDYLWHVVNMRSLIPDASKIRKFLLRIKRREKTGSDNFVLITKMWSEEKHKFDDYRFDK